MSTTRKNHTNVNCQGLPLKRLKYYLLIFAFFVVTGCKTSHQAGKVPYLTEAGWNNYLAKGLEAFNDPAVWKAMGKKKTLSFKLNPKLKPWGALASRDVFSHEWAGKPNWITINIPVMDCGLPPDGGFAHITIIFEHPSGKVIDIFPNSIFF